MRLEQRHQVAAAVVPVLAREVVQQAVRREPREEAHDAGERQVLAGRLRQLAQAVGVEVVVAGVAERVDRRGRDRARRGQLVASSRIVAARGSAPSFTWRMAVWTRSR